MNWRYTYLLREPTLTAVRLSEAFSLTSLRMQPITATENVVRKWRGQTFVNSTGLPRRIGNPIFS